MHNQEIRTKAKENGVKLWEVAERIGLSDSSFSRKLRRDLSEAERIKILSIIEQISAERKEG